MMPKLPLVAALALIANASFAAVPINFSSPLFESARTSTGDALTSSFTFAVGTFNSFVPTTDNVSSWASNWVSFGTTPWHEGDLNFIGSAVLTDNTLAPVGSAMYIWGYNTLTADAGAEWILFSNPTLVGADDWKTPSVVEPNTPKIIGMDQPGTIAVVGAIFTQGNDPYFQTAAVVPEPAHYAGILGAAVLIFGFIRRRK